MNIEFCWRNDADRFIPVCNSNFVNQNGISLLDCILMDDGGLPYLDTIPWLDEGEKRAQSVATGKLDAADWSRETWGVELTKGQAKIYSLHDESYTQIVSLSVFAKILQAWTAFLKSKPDSSRVQIYCMAFDT